MDDSAADALLSEYMAVRAKVDAFCHAAAEASADALTCAAGCSSCCVAQLSVSPVEAHAVGVAVANLPSDQRDALRERAASEDACALLDAEGRCSVYEARPLVCRTQGLALAYTAGLIPVDAVMGRDEAGRDITHCPLNFEHVEPSAASVLDAERVDALLALVNHRYCAALGLDADARVELSALLET